jgi:hypothetical protein
MNTSPLQLRQVMLILWTLFSLLMSATVAAADTDMNTDFALPESISQAEFNTSADVRALLKSELFWQEMTGLGQSLQRTATPDESLFNQLALWSLLQQHSLLLARFASPEITARFYPYQLYSQVALQSAATSAAWPDVFQQQLALRLRQGDDKTFLQLCQGLGWSVSHAERYLLNILQRLKATQSVSSKANMRLDRQQAWAVLANAQLLRVLTAVIPHSGTLVQAEQQRRFEILPRVLIQDGDIELAATVVRKRGISKAGVTALQMTIYADEPAHLLTAMHAAAHGYVGVVANSRGKRGSKNTIVPWEHEGEDAVRVINWISQQPFSDGRVGMFGGSYNGFTQWAATKKLPTALKTIVPSAAASPITGLPIENNIVLTSNYHWSFHVTNNDTVDYQAYPSQQATEQLKQRWYRSGKSITALPALDGQANPWFSKWLAHPDYDEYYQAMLPYRQEFVRINIPVLSITGYFDGGQISALDYLHQHERWHAHPEHYLVIGPYNHGTAQQRPDDYHSNYRLDAVALKKDTAALTFEWFDYVFHQAPKPALLQDKINYQLMGANRWLSAPSLRQLNQQGQRFYLGSAVDALGRYLLQPQAEKEGTAVSMQVDMTDRNEQRNLYPSLLIQSQLPDHNGLVFQTEPFTQPMQFAGSVSGFFSLAVNKKDLDLGFNLYEQTAEGDYFHLINYISRASYAKDNAERQLLMPQQKSKIPLTHTRMSAKLLAKGSRLVLVLNVNKNMHAQVNLGSGKPVHLETLADAAAPLQLQLFHDTEIFLPLTPWSAATEDLKTSGKRQ